MKRLLATALAASLAFAAWAAARNVDPAKSTLVATFKQMNVPVDAPFRQFKGSIDYDAAHVADAKASIEVQTGSFDIGEADYNNEVRKPAWFDSARFPTASFVSTAIKPDGSGFEATGTLTIKGKAQTIKVPVKATSVAGGTAFDGTLKVSRAYFGIGDAEWNDVVDDDVTVRFHIVQTP